MSLSDLSSFASASEVEGACFVGSISSSSFVSSSFASSLFREVADSSGDASTLSDFSFFSSSIGEGTDSIGAFASFSSTSSLVGEAPF